MPYEFTEYDDDLEPQASASLGGGPPRKTTAAGVLDPPIPPRRPPGPLARIPAKWWLRTLTAIVLVAIVATIPALLFAPR